MNPSPARVIVAGTSILGGTAYFVAQLILPYLSPLGLAFFRFAIGGLTLLIVAVMWRQPVTAAVLRAGCIPGFALGAGLTCMVYGLQSSPSSIAAFLVCGDAFLIPVVDRVLYRRKAPPAVLWGLAVGATGLALLSCTGPFEISGGTFILLLAALLWATYYSTLGKVAKSHGSVALCCATHLSAALLVFAGFVIFDTLPEHIPLKVWGGVLYFAIVISALRFTLQTRAQSVISAAEMGLFFLLEPVSAAVIGVVYAGENLSRTQWVGAFLVLIALALPPLMSRRFMRRGPAIPSPTT